MQNFFELKSLIFITWWDNFYNFEFIWKAKFFKLKTYCSSILLNSSANLLSCSAKRSSIWWPCCPSRVELGWDLNSWTNSSMRWISCSISWAKWPLLETRNLSKSFLALARSATALASSSCLWWGYCYKLIVICIYYESNKFLRKNRPVPHCEHQFVPLLQPIYSRVGEAVLQPDGCDSTLKWFRVAKLSILFLIARLLWFRVRVLRPNVLCPRRGISRVLLWLFSRSLPHVWPKSQRVVGIRQLIWK